MKSNAVNAAVIVAGAPSVVACTSQEPSKSRLGEEG
jgi:hypothetical protein